MKFINTKNEPAGHYSPGVISNGILYISGQTSADPETGKPPVGGIVAETQMALKKLEEVLRAAGLSKESVIQCRLFTTSADYWGDVNGVYKAFFGDHKPARLIAPIKELNHGCLIEIEAIAEVE